MSTEKNKKILEEIQAKMRIKRYSIHTERAYCDWVKRYILFHKMQSRDDLKNGAEKVEQFLSHLAINDHVAPATQNQAMNALVFLYKKILKETFDEMR